MTVTLLLSAVMMAGLFLMLYAAVGLIQNKKFFTSAPKDVQAAVQPRGERFPGAHALGWCLMGISFLMMLGALVLGGWDGVRNEIGFLRLFGRFLAMLWLLKAFDVLFFDWVLLCHSNFFPHFYPEVKGVVGPHQFGYNRREHLQMILASPVVAAVLAGMCMLL